MSDPALVERMWNNIKSPFKKVEINGVTIFDEDVEQKQRHKCNKNCDENHCDKENEYEIKFGDREIVKATPENLIAVLKDILEESVEKDKIGKIQWPF